MINGKKQFTTQLHLHKDLLDGLNFIMPAMLLAVLYFAFFMEIVNFWNQLHSNTGVTLDEGLKGIKQFSNNNIAAYKTISILIYTLLFFSVLSFVNILKLKNRILGQINLVLNVFAVVLFLTTGLFALGALRDTYLSQSLSEYFYRGVFTIGIRYFSFVFVAVILYALDFYLRQEFPAKENRMGFDLFLHITVLTIAGNELINWMDLSGSEQSYKLGLSILFGVYALLLILLGIRKKKLHLRIGAIVLFSLTLLKLFLYDLRFLDTISKTIVFVVLGVLLLVISFLYNKYRKVIFEDKAD
jgi:uncharacterized membrane protein